MTAPLQGITVVEAANYVAGPSAGALMADLGADVIKLEPPGGEVMRGLQLTAEGQPQLPNYLFELENRGKRSVTVALDQPGASELVHQILAGADVFLTNMYGSRLRKYGLTPEDVHARNPHIVHVSVTGYGIHGPEADRPAFDFAAFWARSGIMSVIGHPGQPPVLSRIAQGDHTTGLNALAATLAALRLRDLTGKGQVVEVALQQTGVYTIATDMARALIDHRQPPKMDRDAPPNPLFNCYEASDGRWIMLVHMTPDPYWPRLCRAIGRADWEAEPAYATMKGRAADCVPLARVISDVFRQHDSAYWAKTLDANGLIWAPVAELPEVIADPQLRAMNAFQAIDHPLGQIETVGTPFYIREADIRVRGASPGAGEHTHAVLAAAGVLG